jgi:hypothetical protein
MSEAGDQLRVSYKKELRSTGEADWVLGSAFAAWAFENSPLWHLMGVVDERSNLMPP